MKLLRYIELKSEYADNGPAWIGYVTPSRSGRTLYFNGDALSKYKGQGRGSWGGEDRHWAGSGKVLVEAAAISEYLETIGAKCLDTSLRSDPCSCANRHREAACSGEHDDRGSTAYPLRRPGAGAPCTP